MMGKMIMFFKLNGIVSEEEYNVLDNNGEIVTLETDEDYDKCFKFNLKTGGCLNDVMTLGAKRFLKI